MLPAEADGELVRQEVRETAALVQFAVTTAAEHVAAAANHTPTAAINLHDASDDLLDANRWLLWPTAVVLVTCIVYSLVSCLTCARDHGVRELGYLRAVCGLVPTTMLWCLTGAQFALAVGLADFCVAPNQHTVRLLIPPSRAALMPG